MQILFNNETILVCGANGPTSLCVCANEYLVKTKISNNILSVDECKKDCCNNNYRLFHYAYRDDYGTMRINKIGKCSVQEQETNMGIINDKYAFEYPKPDYLMQ